MSKINLFWFLLFILPSCSNESKEIFISKNEPECVVSEFKSVNDSIILSEIGEYYFHIDHDSQKYQFKKQFFKRIHSGSIVEVQIVDSIIIELSINSQYEINRIDNWQELYAKIKSYSNKLLEKTSPERRANLNELIEKVVLDSFAIVTKNTQDIQVYFLVLKEFDSSIKAEGNYFQHSVRDSIESIYGESIIDFQYEELPFEKVSFLPDSQKLDYKNSITAKRNVKTGKILTITHEISTELDGKLYKKTRIMNFN